MLMSVPLRSVAAVPSAGRHFEEGTQAGPMAAVSDATAVSAAIAISAADSDAGVAALGGVGDGAPDSVGAGGGDRGGAGAPVGVSPGVIRTHMG